MELTDTNRSRAYPWRKERGVISPDEGFQCVVLSVWSKRITVSAKTEGIILDSSMVEHSAVNRGVVGSSPTRGAFLH